MSTARPSADPVLIVTTANERFARGAAVMIESLTTHNRVTRIAVLDMGISAASRARIAGLGRARGAEVTFLRAETNPLEHAGVGHGHLSFEAFGRLLLPALLPDEAVILYLDSDLLITGDLSPILTADYGSDLVAAVRDPLVEAAETDGIGVPMADYVNSGVLVMNLAQWRREDTGGACIAYLNDPSRPRRYADQSAINVICRGRIRHLPAAMNVIVPALREGLHDLAADPPRVVHFVGPRKPWSDWPLLWDLWAAHDRRCGPFRIAPGSGGRQPATALAHLNGLRRQWIGAALRRPRHLRKAVIARALRDDFTRPYLAGLRRGPVGPVR